MHAPLTRSWSKWALLPNLTDTRKPSANQCECSTIISKKGLHSEDFLHLPFFLSTCKFQFLSSIIFWPTFQLFLSLCSFHNCFVSAPSFSSSFSLSSLVYSSAPKSHPPCFKLVLSIYTEIHMHTCDSRMNQLPVQPQGAEVYVVSALKGAQNTNIPPIHWDVYFSN